MTPPKKLCLRCEKPRHHSDHNLGVCDWLSPATATLGRQRQDAAERRAVAELRRDVMARDGGCVLRPSAAPEALPPLSEICGFFGDGIQYHHRLTRGRAGKTIDTLENVSAICPGHHDWLHHTAEGQVYGRENGLLLHEWDEEAVPA